MSEDVKRMGRELAYQGTVLKVYKDHMKFSNGNTEDWDFIHHDGAAAVIPVMDDGKILMVKQYRNALERDTLEIPAGKLDSKAEDRLDAAKRELYEETGYRAGKYTDLGPLYTTPAFVDEVIEMYLAEELHTEDDGQHLDEDEFLEVEKIPLAQAVEMAERNEIFDAKTQVLILRAARLVEQGKL